MEPIFQILHRHLLHQKPALLVSVVRSHGSAPRGAGAHMLVDETGILSGTIGGGALEYQSILIAKDWLRFARSPQTQKNPPTTGGFLKHFVLNTDEVKNLGMVCGGDVDVLFTPFLPDSDSKSFQFVQQAYQYFTERTLFWMLFPLNGTTPILLTEETFDSTFASDRYPDLKDLKKRAYAITSYPQPNSTTDMPFDNHSDMYSDIHSHTHSHTETECYIEKMLDTSRVFLFGGGHISRELVPLLSHLKFRCIVSDDRPEFASPDQFPDAEEVRVISFLHLEDSFSIQPEDYIVVLTRGHEWDTEVQKFALKTSARYIGVVGSRKKKAAVFAKLIEVGFTETDLSRITTPIGLDIGAQTPAEIAVSIAAQMIAVRSGK